MPCFRWMVAAPAPPPPGRHVPRAEPHPRPRADALDSNLSIMLLCGGTPPQGAAAEEALQALLSVQVRVCACACVFVCLRACVRACPFACMVCTSNQVPAPSNGHHNPTRLQGIASTALVRAALLPGKLTQLPWRSEEEEAADEEEEADGGGVTPPALAAARRYPAAWASATAHVVHVFAQLGGGGAAV